MKNTIITIIAAFLACNTINAQKLSNDKVPTHVQSAFKAKFPTVTKVSWELENNTIYEAEFNMNGEEVSANFNNVGDWLETETEIKVSALPTTVMEALKKDFVGYKVNEASKIESTKYGNCFEAEIEKDKESFDVIFAQDGVVLNKSKTEK